MPLQGRDRVVPLVGLLGILVAGASTTHAGKLPGEQPSSQAHIWVAQPALADELDAQFAGESAQVAHFATSAEDEEANREAWRMLIDALCALVPCTPTGPNQPKAADCLRLNLIQASVHGLRPGLSAATLSAGLDDIDDLLGMLNGPAWVDLQIGFLERQVLIVRLLAFRLTVSKALGEM